MKRIFLSILIGLCALTAFGQNQGDDVNQRFFDAKIREFTYQLRLTDSQKEAFIPIYQKYSEEMRSAVSEREKPDSRPSTSEEASARTKARIERQQQAQAIRLKYVDQFATVLNPDQLARLYEVEGQIQQKVTNRRAGGRPAQTPRRGGERVPRRTN